MFLSKITYTLPNGDEYLNSDISSYDIHRSMWDFFPDHPDNEDPPFLYQVRRDTIIMVSSKEPVCPSSMWELRTRKYDPKLDADTELFFEIKLCPGYAFEGKRHHYIKYKCYAEDGCLINLNTRLEELTLKWFDKRSETLGFTVKSLRVPTYRFRSIPKPSQPFNIEELTVEGVLVVKDPDVLLSRLFTGIGRAKRLGCGLMTVS